MESGCLILVASCLMVRRKKGFMAETMNPWVGHWLSVWLVIHGITGRFSVSLLPFSGLWLGENHLEAGPDVLSPAEAC